MDPAILRSPEPPPPQDSRYSPVPVTLDLVSLRKLDLVERQQNLQVLSTVCWQWKPTISRRRMLVATLGASFSTASRSASAFSIHSRNRDSRSGSSGFIDNAPILVSWVRNAADKALRSFEAVRPHHNDIHRVSYVPHGAPDRHSPLVGVCRRRFHHQKINEIGRAH